MKARGIWGEVDGKIGGNGRYKRSVTFYLNILFILLKLLGFSFLKEEPANLAALGKTFQNKCFP